jgi:hypothetical protein
MSIMKTQFLYAAITLLFISCEKDKQNKDLNPEKNTVILTNLISNSGFEINGLPSISGWDYVDGPCNLDTFSADVPAGGGVSSLKLEPLWLPAQGAMETYLTGLTCNCPFRLNFQAKCINLNDPLVSVSVYKKATSIASLPSISFFNNQWTPYVLFTPTFNLTSSDTLVVKLSAGSTEVANWQVLFDQIELYKLP